MAADYQSRSHPSVHQVRVNMTAIEQTQEVRAVRERTLELTEFIHHILKVREFPWPHKVGVRYDRNAMRGIHLAIRTEIKAPWMMAMNGRRQIFGSLLPGAAAASATAPGFHSSRRVSPSQRLMPQRESPRLCPKASRQSNNPERIVSAMGAIESIRRGLMPRST
jgi:hypothetical protein